MTCLGWSRSEGSRGNFFKMMKMVECQIYLNVLQRDYALGLEFGKKETGHLLECNLICKRSHRVPDRHVQGYHCSSVCNGEKLEIT